MRPDRFSELTDRRGANSLKRDVAKGELPMWVADMDFRTAPEIVDAIPRKPPVYNIFHNSIGRQRPERPP
ncbi:hypothetical protein PV416_08935 [Streptomyces ipomoeae]|uniref:Aminotransferase class I/classII domain-containing protein n=1 Tax=Streptomyces ipomoeae 91-03 TaxID=698759 RepID=L1L7C0_9ACTN|nr:hypothetical protein [Streptomyces ipomoeae]EKX68600.1 hypothetical protein STRIP9103_09322 [Streptomyces ipomoeae 91-03]MDX2694048.1 hypothetical protein [Streptomyces ipomoeae]MDX2821216.1 hypothetical protein [Streptomyces ipomoeae]MDX2839956.1 hypothetical protein [Streptomyces ipomoeae]MDX2874182.1 hypothetical protein [Streptomyces ipomoeae]